MTSRLPAVALPGLLVAAAVACDPARNVYDLEGRPVEAVSAHARATVLLFVRVDCPISNRYAPEFRRICERFSEQGVHFSLVYPDPRATPATIRQHLEEFSYPCGALRDPEHALVERVRARITPEAAVFLPDGRLVYRGRIDNRFVDLGKTRPAPTEHDLVTVLSAIVDGHDVDFRATEAVGCFIEDLR